MHKLRVGLIVDSYLPPIAGGTYSYYHTLLNGINEYDFDESIEIVNIVFYTRKKPPLTFNKPIVYIRGFISNSLKRNLGKKISRKKKAGIKSNPILNFFFSIIEKRNNSSIEHQLAINNIDFVYYLKPEEPNLINYPFITNHWDLIQRSTFSFPEMAINNSYEKKEEHYLKTLNKALLILCESDAGANELKQYYSFNPDKIKVLPIFSGSDISLNTPTSAKTLSTFGLQVNSFFLYPAQFWSFKNHYNLILAFGKLKNKQNDNNLKLVLCGSDHGNMSYIKSIVNELKLNDSVLFAGFVTNEELIELYSNAIALVMPTFLGPTNMPLIEAAQLKCPVLCSNLTGHHEIMGSHALYFEPENFNSIEEAMLKIMSDEQQRISIINSAFVHINASKFNLNKSLNTLNQLLLQIKPIRKTWGIGLH